MILSQAFGRDLVHNSIYYIKDGAGAIMNLFCNFQYKCVNETTFFKAAPTIYHHTDSSE